MKKNKFSVLGMLALALAVCDTGNGAPLPKSITITGITLTSAQKNGEAGLQLFNEWGQFGCQRNISFKYSIQWNSAL